MKLDTQNTFLLEKNDGFCICIAVPDGSRNYIHSQPLEINKALYYREELLSKKLDLRRIHSKIENADAYFRIVVGFTMYKKTGYREYSDDIEITLRLHSRKLNLYDAITEFDLLTGDYN